MSALNTVSTQGNPVNLAPRPVSETGGNFHHSEKISVSDGWNLEVGTTGNALRLDLKRALEESQIPADFADEFAERVEFRLGDMTELFPQEYGSRLRRVLLKLMGDEVPCGSVLFGKTGEISCLLDLRRTSQMVNNSLDGVSGNRSAPRVMAAKEGICRVWVHERQHLVQLAKLIIENGGDEDAVWEEWKTQGTGSLRLATIAETAAALGSTGVILMNSAIQIEQKIELISAVGLVYLVSFFPAAIVESGARGQDYFEDEACSADEGKIIGFGPFTFTSRRTENSQHRDLSPSPHSNSGN